VGLEKEKQRTTTTIIATDFWMGGQIVPSGLSLQMKRKKKEQHHEADLMWVVIHHTGLQIESLKQHH
jgi:hypothetical protein